MRLPGGVLSGRLSKSPGTAAVAAFALFYLFGIWLVRHISWRDPGSLFFDLKTAYERQYSSVRLQQAEEYLANASSEVFGRHGRHSDKDPELCVGVVSIARVGARYLHTAVASLVEGLTVEERDALHLIVFIPHVDPSIHPAYHDQWIINLADQRLLYNLTGDEFDKVKDWEERQHTRSKIMYDYQYLMRACYETRAPYIALLEDDTLAMDGWYHRTMHGMKDAERKAAVENTKRKEKDFLYMRLFYTEEYFGWNIEDAPTRAFWCTLLITSVAVLLLGFRFRFPDIKDHLTDLRIAVVCCICIPLLIILYFSAGKVTTLPHPAGVNQMNNYGCCAQGLVWPRHKAKELMDWYDTDHPLGFGDMLIEEYADRRGEMRYALTPSVIQHIGSISSRVGDEEPEAKHNRPLVQTLWNFAFEMNDADALRREHERVIEETWPS